MRRLLASLLLLPLAAQAQEDLRTNPRTGEPRSAFEPISYDEVGDRMGSCLDREIGDASGVKVAALFCEAEALDFCARVTAECPIAYNERALSVQLAWGELRFEAGQTIIDALYAPLNGTADDEPVRVEAEAFSAADDTWRVKLANSCLGDMEPEARIACETATERDRAVLYYARLSEMAVSP